MRKESFGTFITDMFGIQMQKLGYQYGGVGTTKQIYYQPRVLALYRLAFFSRSQLGMKFWEDAVKYASLQRPLF